MGLGYSIHKQAGWLGQLNRIDRWHQRVQSAALTGSLDLEDFIYVFFLNCYHLRDWMQQTGGASQSELDLLFSQSKPLQLCRDICNGTKHFNISRPSIDANFSIGREYAPSEPSGTRLFIIADDKYDLLHLAKSCIEAWQAFASRARA